MTKKIICYADILGFSTKFQSLSTIEKREVYLSLITKVEDACHWQKCYSDTPKFNSKRCDFYWFSDAFILFSEDDYFMSSNNAIIETRLSTFFHSVKMLFLHFLSMGFPLRGGIDYGEFIGEPEKNIFLGEALINAVKMSDKHKWSGISLTPGFSDFIRPYNLWNGSLIAFPPAWFRD